jgi:cytosine/adenosine deaminase-related metal-dependent hydrolase
MSDNQILIHNAAYIITMDYERRIIKNGSILIENDRIAALGKMLDLSQLNVDKVINAQDMVITPGFVNGHCHISYAHATRGIFPDDLGNDYLVNVFRLQDSMSPKEEFLTSLLAITELLSYGTTTIMDPGSTKHVDLCMEAYEQSGVRLITGIQVTDRDNPYRMTVYSHDEALQKTESFITQYNGRLEGKVHAWAMPFSPEYVGGPLLKDLKLLSDQLEVGSTLHINNAGRFKSDGSKESPILALEEYGFVGSNVTLAHCVGLSDKEIASLASTGTAVITCPTNVVKNGGGYGKNFPLSDLLEANVRVGLGTDAGNNSNLLETNRSMYLAAVLIKDATGDATQIPPEKALELATIDGAKALGLGSEIGSLEVGKKADIVMYDTLRPEWRSLFNPVNSLVYSADGRSVKTVIVDGHVVIEDYVPNFVDTEKLIREVQDIGTDIMKRNEVSFPQKWPIV